MAKLKKMYHVFPWLDFKAGRKEPFSKVINGNKVQEIYHFSSSQIHGQIGEISTLISKRINFANNKINADRKRRGFWDWVVSCFKSRA